MANILKFENRYINLDFVADFYFSGSGDKEELTLTVVGIKDDNNTSNNVNLPIGTCPELRAIILGWLDKNRIDAGVS